jgi:hypothetical protein
MSQPTDGATLQSSEPSENVASPIWKTRLRPKRSAIGTRQHQEAREDQGVGVDRPLETADDGVQVVLNGGQRDVDDGDVDADDEEAHATNRQRHVWADLAYSQFLLNRAINCISNNYYSMYK